MARSLACAFAGAFIGFPALRSDRRLFLRTAISLEQVFRFVTASGRESITSSRLSLGTIFI